MRLKTRRSGCRRRRTEYARGRSSRSLNWRCDFRNQFCPRMQEHRNRIAKLRSRYVVQFCHQG